MQERVNQEFVWDHPEILGEPDEPPVLAAYEDPEPVPDALKVEFMTLRQTREKHTTRICGQRYTEFGWELEVENGANAYIGDMIEVMEWLRSQGAVVGELTPPVEGIQYATVSWRDT